jgi:hypothetical protein
VDHSTAPSVVFTGSHAVPANRWRGRAGGKTPGFVPSAPGEGRPGPADIRPGTNAPATRQWALLPFSASACGAVLDLRQFHGFR